MPPPGSTLLLIPALGCNEKLYAPMLRALGGPIKPKTLIPSANRYPGMVRQVLAAVPGPFIVMGTSMGGRLALETALAEPDRVLGLIVIGAGAGPVADQKAGLHRSERLRGGEFLDVITEMAGKISHLDGPNGESARDAFVTMVEELGPEITADQSDALAYRTDQWPNLHRITCPTLCLWGREDKFSPYADGMHMAQAVKRGRYVELPDCGHFPSLEYPEQTATIIKHWLRDNNLLS